MTRIRGICIKNDLQLLLIFFSLAFLIIPGAYGKYEQSSEDELQIQTSVHLFFDEKCCDEERSFVWDHLDLTELDKEMKKAGMLNGINVLIEQHDLNDDKVKDLLVLIRSQYHCGSRGCSFMIFIQQENGQYIQTEDNFVSYGDIRISKNKTGGMYDLIFRDRFGEFFVRTWNGMSY